MHAVKHENPLAESLTPDLPICAGYMDRTLEIFARHQHPFVLVGTLAVRWCGVDSIPDDAIDVLVRPSDATTLVQELIDLKEWAICGNPTWKEEIVDDSMINTSPINDIWLESRIQDPYFRYMRLWPETLYSLSTACAKVEVPDLASMNSLLLEDEYYRDSLQRFGPRRASLHPRSLLPRLQIQAKLLRKDIPIYIPTIEAHLNALLDQLRAEHGTGLQTGNFPARHIELFTRYLYFDWPPNREWILSTKIQDRNRELMKAKIDRYRRWRGFLLWDVGLNQYVSGKLPWELNASPARLTSTTE
ncbi:MAG: hypothetical protein Q9186_000716 [Xanthomendoza sp. 1 TL-2023]